MGLPHPATTFEHIHTTNKNTEHMSTSLKRITEVMMVPAQEEWDQIQKGEYRIERSPAPATVLDIGGAVGAFGAWAKSQWPEAKITAYEPQAESVDCYKKNVPDANIIQAAVRDFTGRCPIYLGKSSSWASSFWQNETHHDGKTEIVDVVDSKDIPSAEWVKIDAEGSELEILSHLDTSATKCLVVEWHSTKNRSLLDRWAWDHGFFLHDSFDTINGCGISKFTKYIEDKLFVAVPCYGDSPYQFNQCIQTLLLRPPCHLMVRFQVGDSLVTRARNVLASAFMRSNCSKLQFIDADFTFKPSDVLRMFKHPEPLVGGCYPKKIPGDPQWVLNSKDGCEKPGENGLQEVMYVGTGFMRIDRSVLTAMINAHRIDYIPDHDRDMIEWDFFPSGIYVYKDGYRRHLSEDWFICQNWIDLGGKVFADTKVVLQHIGQATYPILREDIK